jgi:hypothetical protein
MEKEKKNGRDYVDDEKQNNNLTMLFHPTRGIRRKRMSAPKQGIYKLR